MKGYESTKEDRERWKKEGYIVVACRLCGDLMLFSKDHYTEQDLIGYECPSCLRRIREYGRI